MIRQYYYIDEDVLPRNTGTGNPEMQAKIEKHLEEKTEEYKYDPLTGLKIKIKGKKRTLSLNKKTVIESEQDYLILREPLVIGEVNDVI